MWQQPKDKDIELNQQTTVEQVADSWQTNIFSIDNIVRSMVLLSVFFTIISPAMTMAMAIAAVLGCCTKTLRQQIRQVVSISAVRIGLVYFLLVVVGLLYVQNIVHQSTKGLMLVGMATVLYPLLLPLFTNPKWRRRLLFTLFASACYMGFMTLLDGSNVLPASMQHLAIFRIRSVQQSSTLIALGIYLALYLAQLLEKPAQKVALIASALLLTVIVMTCQVERVGIVLAFLAIGVFIVQYSRPMYWLLWIVALLGFFLSLYHLSPAFKGTVLRTHNAALNVKSQPGTSVGIRWHANTAALKLSQAAPWFGFGTGALNNKEQPLPMIPGLHDEVNMLNAHSPESDFMFVLIDHGWIGLMVFLLWLAAWWWQGRKLDTNNYRLLTAMLILFCLANCSFPLFGHTRPWVWLYAIILITCGSLLQQGSMSLSASRDN